MVHPRHHQSLRRRSKKSKSEFVLWFDRFIVLAGILSVIATVPQVLEIWVNKSADGVSSITWAYYVFYSSAFTAYGVVHKEFPIVFNYSTA